MSLTTDWVVKNAVEQGLVAAQDSAAFRKKIEERTDENTVNFASKNNPVLLQLEQKLTPKIDSIYQRDNGQTRKDFNAENSGRSLLSALATIGTLGVGFGISSVFLKFNKKLTFAASISTTLVAAVAVFLKAFPQKENVAIQNSTDAQQFEGLYNHLHAQTGMAG